MTITYEYEGALYVNLTNRCNCNCEFCLRHGKKEGSIYTEDSLWLEREPTRQEALDSFLSRDVCSYREIVFCGYGEPTERLHDMLTMAKELKKMPHCPPLRLDTNGLSSLVYGYDTVPDIAERFDAVSISLNAPTAAEYAALCPSPWGEEAFFAMLDFARHMRPLVRDTRLTVVDVIGEEAVAQARELARRLDIPLHVRHYQGPEEK